MLFEITKIYEAECQNKKRLTRCEVFLERMEKLIPRKQWEKEVVRYYREGQSGRPPYPLSTMLHVTACSCSLM